ncbi:hypothetical protein ACE1OE_10460 [Vibrio sp. E150_011]
MVTLEQVTSNSSTCIGRRNIVQLPGGTIVFNQDYLCAEVSELKGLLPQLVFFDGVGGIFKDFGNGMYGFLPIAGFKGGLKLRCVVENVVIRVKCDLKLWGDEAIPLEFGHISAREPKVSYSLLSDGTLFISKNQIADALAINPAVDDHLRVLTIVSTSSCSYVKQCQDYALLVPRFPGIVQSQAGTKTGLHITLTNVSDSTSVQYTIFVDPVLFASIVTRPLQFSASKDTCVLTQQQLLIDAHKQLTSPILFVERLYSIDRHALCEPSDNGSFEVALAPYKGTCCNILLYSISDAIETIATGVTMLSPQTVGQKNIEHEVMKWAAIELNTRDIIDIAAQPDIAKPTLKCSNGVSKTNDLEGKVTLTIPSSSKGLETLFVYLGEVCNEASALSFDLIFMPNVSYQSCVVDKSDHHWQVSRRELQQLVSQRSRKRIQRIDIHCRHAFVTSNDLKFCTLWTIKPSEIMRLNLTLNFEDGTVGFSSVSI